MTTLVDVLQVAYLVASGVTVGGLVSESVLILPAIRALPAQQRLVTLDLIAARAWRYLPVAGVGAAAAALAVLLLDADDPNSAELLLGAGLVFSFFGGVVFGLALYLPADRRLRQAAPEGPEHEALFRRFATWHALRTVCTAASLLCFAGATALE